jgi:hypothetical protein
MLAEARPNLAAGLRCNDCDDTLTAHESCDMRLSVVRSMLDVLVPAPPSAVTLPWLRLRHCCAGGAATAATLRGMRDANDGRLHNDAGPGSGPGPGYDSDRSEVLPDTAPKTTLSMAPVCWQRKHVAGAKAEQLRAFRQCALGGRRRRPRVLAISPSSSCGWSVPNEARVAVAEAASAPRERAAASFERTHVHA